MKKQIVINASKDRSRIAIVEDGELVELYVENPDNVRTIGNIYLGKVKKVMPTLRAAFVDIGHTTPAGEKQDAFLHFSDLTENFPQLLKMAGEDVPGLEEPVLSLAPQKRIADDASEPDVEETLELAEPDAEAEPNRARSTRSRRSRGRGGRRRSGGEGRAQEEEEQEEAGDERPRRAVAVIDLTSRPKPAAPKPARPARTPAAEAPAAVEDAPAPAAVDHSPAAEEPSEDATARRPRRRTRGGSADPAVETSSDATEARATPTESAPAAAEAPPAAHAEPTASAEPAPSGRPPRRKPRARGSAEATPVETPAPARTPAPEPVTPEPVAEAEPVAATASEPEAAAEATTDGRPPRRTRRRTRGGADEPATADEPAETPARAEETAPASHTEAPKAPAPPPKPRGTLTIDLTAPARPARPAPAPAADDDAPAAPSTSTEADDDDASEGRSRRRRSRGGRSTEADTTPEAAETPAETAPAPAEPDARSRRRTRGSDDDTPARTVREADSTPADRTPADRTPTDRASGNRDAGDRGRGANGRTGEPARAPGRKPVPIPPNEQLLRSNGHVIVKVTKEPISAKGSRVSTDISLAGRFLVLVPAADYVAVSKKIESAKERRRLRTLAEGLKPSNCGVIVRTVAEGQDAKSLDADLRLLIRKWNDIEARLDGGRAKAPLLLYEDLNMVSSIIRDLFSDDFDRILVDDPALHKTVQAYVKAVAPHMAERVVLHTAASPVFRAVGIESQVEGAFSKRVPLKSGGYLFIETTEAMHVVDVNSGRAGRGKSQKENMIAVNVEAAREIAKQLRLRDLGGIIVVDFIDLKMDADRRKVTNALKDEFEKDRAVTKLLPMSDFGVVQITRQRLRPSITTQADDEDEDVRDPATLAARAGAGEIEQAPRRGGRSRDLDVPETEAEAPASPPRGDRDRSRRRGDDDRRDSRREDRRDDRREDAPAPTEATPEALARGLRRWLDHYKATVDERHRDRPVTVRVHPLFAAHLRRGFPSLVTRWRFSVRGFPWQIAEDAAVDPLAFDVRDDKSGRSLTKKYTPTE